MNRETWITKIASDIFDACMVLEHIRDYPQNGEEEGWTDLEKQIYKQLEPVWEMCRQHPEYFEPSHETHPHLIDEEGEIIPFSSDAAREKRITGYKEAIIRFCDETKTTKKDFAAAYGCLPNYLSRIIKGSKAANHDNFVAAFHKLGYMPKAKQEDWIWSWEKLSTFL